jgi:glycosyltransferase involved in cell wall biosynthesis
VRRLIVAEPYRSVAADVRDRVRRVRSPAFPASAERTLYSPRRLRRRSPVRPAGTVARYERGLRALAAARGLDHPAVISVDPLLAGFGRFDWSGPVTYYGVDDWTASSPHERWWPAYEEAFAGLRAAGRAVVGVSQGIVDRVAPTGPSAVIPNGIDPEEWLAPGRAPDWLEPLPRPRITYAGSLDSRVDVSALAAVADAFPQGSVVVVGPMVDEQHFRALGARPNVTIGPQLDRAGVTWLIRESDACVIPHAANDLTRSMSPLKLFEYLAAGRPVAAIDLPPIAAAATGRVVLVDEGGDFAGGVRRALALGPAPEPERREFIADNSWERRFERLLEVALGN